MLLILAAVTINLTIGENGIFKRAQNAVDKYEIAALEEKLKMEELTAYIDAANGDSFSEKPVKGIYSFEKLKDEENVEIIMDCIIELDGQLYRAKIRGINEEIQLESAIKVNEVENIAKPIYILMFSNNYEDIEFAVEKGEYILLRYKKVNYSIKIQGSEQFLKVQIDYYHGAIDSEPGDLYGDGTEDSPYLIQSIEDLVGFSKESEYNNFGNKHIELFCDLDFNSDESYVNPNTTEFGDINKNEIVEPLKTELTTATGFKPIKEFSGNFNGNNYTISNLYMNKGEYESQGLFSSIYGGGIRNLKVTGNINSTAENVGGIVGTLGTYTYIENCTSEVNITAVNSKSVGGICAAEVPEQFRIENSYNYGSISLLVKSTETDVITIGGIISESNGGNIINCINYGEIQTISDGTNLYKDEICGKNYDRDEVIINCENNANIKVETTLDQGNFVTFVGGIVGVITHIVS